MQSYATKVGTSCTNYGGYASKSATALLHLRWKEIESMQATEIMKVESAKQRYVHRRSC